MTFDKSEYYYIKCANLSLELLRKETEKGNVPQSYACHRNKNAVRRWKHWQDYENITNS